MINKKENASKKNSQLKKWTDPTLTKFNKADFVKGGFVTKTGVEDIVYKPS